MKHLVNSTIILKRKQRKSGNKTNLTNKQNENRVTDTHTNSKNAYQKNEKNNLKKGEQEAIAINIWIKTTALQCLSY